jgi:hypothetical protein
MEFIEKLKEEHEEVERELVELEEVMENPEVNYSNLVHVLKKLYNLWDAHEQKEELIFGKFKREKILVPVRKMHFDHEYLRKHKDSIKEAIESGSELKLKNCFESDVKQLIIKLRRHMESEEMGLFVVPFENVFSEKEVEELNNIANN